VAPLTNSAELICYQSVLGKAQVALRGS